jgi:hypothetical protein
LNLCRLEKIRRPLTARSKSCRGSNPLKVLFHLAGRNSAPVELLQEFGPGQVGELRCLAPETIPWTYPWTAAAMRISRASPQGVNRRAPKAEPSKSKLILVVITPARRLVVAPAVGVKAMDWE